MRAQHTHPASIAPIDKRAGVPKGTKQQWVPELEVPVQIESQIKAALQPLVVLEDKLSGGRLAISIRPISTEEAISCICQTYEELQQQGFAGSDIENAITALILQANFRKDKVHLPVVTLAPVLDWLLYYLDRNKLPPLYAGQVHARGGEAGVENVRRPVQQESMACYETVDDLAEAGALDTAAIEDMPSVTPKDPTDDVSRRQQVTEKDEDGEKEEEAKRAHKAWLLRRLADSSSSDSCSDDSDREPDRDSDVELDMWGADPSEIQRQKIIKARQSLSRDDRIRLISEEMFQAKDCATRAKLEGDKNAQKEYGRLIGELRKEMASLGLTEADLVPTTVNNTAALSDSKSNSPRGGKDLSNQENEEREDSIPFSALFGDGGNDEGGVLDALESTETVEERSAKRRMKKLEAAGFLSKSTTNGGKVVKAPFPGSAALRASCSSKMQYYEKKGGLMPKAALQKFCQSQGWPAPTYVRLPFAPSTEANGGYRYSLNVKKVGHTGDGKGAKAFRFTLPESLDGWSSSEDAQNAVATLALVTLCPQCSKEMWKDFKDPLFAELWLTLEDGTWQSNHGKDGQEAEVAHRDSFARSVLDGFMSLEKLDSKSDVRSAQGGDHSPHSSAEKVTITQSTASQGLNEQFNTKHSIKNRHDNATLVLAQKRKRQKGKDLPVTAIREELLEALAMGDVAVVTGDTGSGKTTQIPQFILENYEERNEACHIICTQPRRIAAISVAERVAQERGEPPPGKPGSTLGYAVRLDTAMTGDTRLLFCTTGILLRRMASDHRLSNVTHVIVDEVHERTVQGDFLMALLRDLVLVRRQAGHPLKIILMSATLDSAKLSEYFGSCPTLHAQGRTFPVQQLFLEDVYEWLGDSYVLASDSPAALKGWGAKSRQYLQSAAVRSKHRAMVAGGWGDEADGASGEGFEVLNPYVKDMNADVLGSYSLSTRRNLARVNDEVIDFDLLEALLGYIHETQDPGAVLVFLPGMGEILRALGRFESNKRLGDCWFVALHSSISSAEQRKAFQSPPRGFSRKIVLSTNIAETSLTIEDIVYVVDSGKVKERRYDAKRAMSLLVETWVSVASAKQRRGRAGRVRPGICYSLYPQYLIASGRMKAFQVPEVARVPLEELVLQIHYLGVSHQSSSVGGAVAFTSRLLQPPPVKSVEGAVRVLQEIGALEIDMHSGNDVEKLTALGNLLARLPVDVRLGKLLILGACLRCLSPALSIAACASVGGGAPFDSGRLQQQQRQQQHQYWSDHLDMAVAVDGWLSAWKNGERGTAKAYVRKHGLRQEVLEMVADIRKQFAILLEDAGVIESRTTCDDPNSVVNVHARSHAVVKCAIVGAMAPQVVSRGVVGVSDAGETLTYWHDGFGPVAPHPSSSCAKLVLKSSERMYPFVAYQEKVLHGKGKGKGSGSSIKPTGGHAHLRDCTAVGAAALVVAGGGELVIDYDTGRLEVRYASNRLVVRASARSGVMVARLREGLELALESIVNKQLRWKETAEKIVDVITVWLKEEENSQRMMYSKAVT
jgi:ATP-dependent RNA helicase DHX29